MQSREYSPANIDNNVSAKCLINNNFIILPSMLQRYDNPLALFETDRDRFLSRNNRNFCAVNIREYINHNVRSALHKTSGEKSKIP